MLTRLHHTLGGIKKQGSAERCRGAARARVAPRTWHGVRMVSTSAPGGLGTAVEKRMAVMGRHQVVSAGAALSHWQQQWRATGCVSSLSFRLPETAAFLSVLRHAEVGAGGGRRREREPQSRSRQTGSFSRRSLCPAALLSFFSRDSEPATHAGLQPAHTIAAARAATPPQAQRRG